MVAINNNMSHRQFQLEMTKWAVRNVPLIGKAVHSAVVQATFKGIVEKTPVLTGLARGNWLLGINAYSVVAIDTVFGGSVTGEPQTGAERSRINSITKKLKALPLGQTVYIVNNQPYIVGLEDGTISKKTPPHAMVQGTIINTLDGLQVDIRSIPELN